MPSSIMTRSACDTANPNPSLIICCDGLGMTCPPMPGAWQQSTNNGRTQGSEEAKVKNGAARILHKGATSAEKNPLSTLFIGAKLRHRAVILAGRSRSCEEPANETTMSKRQK